MENIALCCVCRNASKGYIKSNNIENLHSNFTEKLEACPKGIEEDLIFQIETLCELLHTNFSAKTKDLLVDWKIDKLAELKQKSPEIFQEYQLRIQGNKKAY